MGEHAGVHGFTIGQRKGLGVALGKPAFVVGLDAATSTVRLGSEDDLLSTAALLDGAAWSDDAAFPLAADVRVRARHDGEPAVIDREIDPATGAEIFVARFRAPVRAVSPGQIAVAYQGDRVLGGGMITRAIAASGAPS